MSCDFLALTNADIRTLQPYQTGKPIEELQRELGLDKIVKLASNENPLGFNPNVKAAIAAHLDGLTRYPDGAGFELKKAISEKLAINADQITIGNGSNDVLDLIGLCFLNANTSAIYAQHAFVVYPLMVKFMGAKGIEVPAKDWGHDLDAMLAAIQDDTRVIFIANPNNPTGTWLGRDALRKFMQQVPENIIVVLDEAYSEYIHDVDYADGIALQKEFANVIVVRTFSKVYGLAGLRVGFSVSSPQLSNILNRVREPFNVNTLAQVGAIAALKDDAFVKKTVAINDAGRAQIEAGLQKLNLTFIPSQGNFICFDTGTDALAVYNKLLAKGVIVRPVVPYGMPTHLRVSIGLEDENQTFLDALVEVL